MITRLILILFLVCAGMTKISEGQTLAERLRYTADAKLLIIHGDDIGMCHSANVAAIDALEKGIVTSGSVMVPCPWFMEIAAYAREHPDIDLGLHLTHTAEWKHYRWGPLAGRSVTPGLVDERGYMHPDVFSVVRSSNAREIEAETRAQIEFALKHGMKPTHLDSHMGTLYAIREFADVAIKLAEEYDIPLMLFHLTPHIRQMLDSRDFYTPAFVESLETRDFPLLDALYQIHNTPVEKSEEFYRNVIRNLQPGVSELIIHLADASKEIEAISSSHRQRVEDYRIFTSPEMREFIREQGVQLIGWKDLYQLWKERKPIK
ncbi:MAG: ChbG/HpnK family deacetylase [Candidatus Omnitrophota bacterium]|jgi:predicted glycoside hydrolase/deacetylase ChbG (UPF0249 family)|nr:MAG: ChbG/HpnK family deacetylase [Candidatus Omnitrophota bacterium]